MKRREIFQHHDAAIATPRDRSFDLPPLFASAPSSPPDVLGLAINYAAEHKSYGSERRLVKAAWRALMTAFPRVAHQDLADRVAGVEVLKDYLSGVDEQAGSAPGRHP